MAETQEITDQIEQQIIRRRKKKHPTVQSWKIEK